MQSRYFIYGIVALFFLSLFSGLTFVSAEADVMYCGKSDGKLNDQPNKMLI